MLLASVAALIVMAALPISGADGSERPAFNAEKLSFSARLQGQVSPYKVFFAPIKAEDRLKIEIEGASPSAAFDFSADAGTFSGVTERAAVWTPEFGPTTFVLSIRERSTGETMTINVFVMVPATAIVDNHLNGYRMGSYPPLRERGGVIYARPEAFIEVRRGMESIPVSPHFTIGQFLCKQAATGKKYLILRPLLVLKLEYLLQKTNDQGYRSDSFHVMSGYRTPYYNKAIGNVPYSRHVWGGAADIFIDENPKDGIMDDLNGDGAHTRADAALLYDMVSRLSSSKEYGRFVGGLGEYRRTSVHGPFIHVDVRGRRARWGGPRK